MRHAGSRWLALLLGALVCSTAVYVFAAVTLGPAWAVAWTVGGHLWTVWGMRPRRTAMPPSRRGLR